jgi:hypothetical protein
MVCKKYNKSFERDSAKKTRCTSTQTLCLKMKIDKEVIIGIIVTLSVFATIAFYTGIDGILYLGISLIIVILSLNLFSRKSLAAKTSAVVINTDLIYKILMPRKYKNKIKELEEKENNEKT